MQISKHCATTQKQQLPIKKIMLSGRVTSHWLVGINNKATIPSTSIHYCYSLPNKKSAWPLNYANSTLSNNQNQMIKTMQTIIFKTKSLLQVTLTVISTFTGYTEEYFDDAA